MGAGPVRTCAGCRTARPQRALIRVVNTGGGLEVDPRAPSGRGAYVCVDEACVDRALKGSLRRSLRLEGPVPPELRTRLLNQIEIRKKG